MTNPSPERTGIQDARVDTPPQDTIPTGLPTPAGQPHQRPSHHHGHGHGHGWMMWLMCLPMVLIVGYLVSTGAASGGSLFYALGCMLMMVVMMRFMIHDSGGKDK